MKMVRIIINQNDDYDGYDDDDEDDSLAEETNAREYRKVVLLLLYVPATKCSCGTNQPRHCYMRPVGVDIDNNKSILYSAIRHLTVSSQWYAQS